MHYKIISGCCFLLSGKRIFMELVVKYFDELELDELAGMV